MSGVLILVGLVIGWVGLVLFKGAQQDSRDRDLRASALVVRDPHEDEGGAGAGPGWRR